MKKYKIIFITILSICLLGISLFITSCSVTKPKLKSNIAYWQMNDYSELPYGSRLEKFLPTFNDNKNYSATNFYYHEGCVNFDYAEAAYCLELDFNESEYNQSKESALQCYNFLEEINFENEKLMLANYKLGDYDVRLVDISDVRFPHEIGLIAFDDSINRLRYCLIVSMSLDYFENEAAFRKWITSNLKISW